jgi:hypothetical protein
MSRALFRLWIVGTGLLCTLMSLISAIVAPKGAAPITKLAVFASYNAVALGVSLVVFILLWLVIRLFRPLRSTADRH